MPETLLDLHYVLSSVRQLADASGNIVQSYTYAPFGELLAAQGTRPSALQYTGEQTDLDTGLVYLRARWYDSATGRFTTRDPFPGFAALPQTLHPYVYVNNNPVNLTDPSGKFVFVLLAAVLGGIIGGVSYYTLQAIINADPCLGVQWHWQEALFWGGAGGVIGGLIGAAAYGGWWLGVKAISWGGGGATARACADGDCTNEIRTGIDWLQKLVGDCSFSADTLVATEEGEQSISTLEIGDHVLAFDQSLNMVGPYTVTAILVHEDPIIEYVTINGERITTTPEHPFYTQVWGWLPASALWVGAQVRRADDSYGVVENIEIVQRPQTMYNLTVAQAHTFFVGEQKLLVHNACWVNFQQLGGFARDVLTKYYHLNSQIGELSLRATRLADGSIQIQVIKAGVKTGEITKNVIEGVRTLLSSDPNGAIVRARAIITTFSSDPNYAKQVQEAKLLLEAFTNGNYSITK
jgi:RHS repeat-associated protein